MRRNTSDPLYRGILVQGNDGSASDYSNVHMSAGPGASAAAQRHTWSTHSRRMEPISLSAKQFCHSDPVEIGLSRMPMAPQSPRAGWAGQGKQILDTSRLPPLTWINANFADLRCCSVIQTVRTTRWAQSLSTAPRRGNAFPPACALSVRRLALCRFSSAAPTAHRAVPFTTGLLGTHGSVITAPTTAIRTARGGSCCGEYPRPHISMNSGHLPPFFRQFPDALTSRQFSFAFGAADPAPPTRCE